jgi:excisionase family DNA binding protein
MESTNYHPKPEDAHERSVHELDQEYLTTAELARRLRWSVRTVRAKIQAGVLRRGEHFFQPEGCRYLWKWSKVAEWVESGRSLAAERLRLFTI